MLKQKSNRSFTTSNSNIYLRGRNPFEMLNRRFNLDIHAYYDDEAISEMDIMKSRLIILVVVQVINTQQRYMKLLKVNYNED
ncbi:hypothetical protein CoNPh35_CDS0011 [Staphylococcus phage S-CoN_Ph35]|nr:hypothetical protein CoNPh35_CDS0011 [Staphylococcus phage S-CoN_Ph35]